MWNALHHSYGNKKQPPARGMEQDGYSYSSAPRGDRPETDYPSPYQHAFQYDREVYMVNGEMVERAKPISRASQERMKYLDSTCTFMCGAPAFEFGLWPYIPYILSIILSVLAVWAYSILDASGLHTAKSFLVLGIGVGLCLYALIGLALFMKKSMEEHSQRKKKKQKPVLSVQGDESRRGYIVSDGKKSSSSSHSEMRHRQDRHASISMRHHLHRADMSRASKSEVDEEMGLIQDRCVEDELEEEDEAFQHVPAFMMDETMLIIREALTSKLTESTLMFAMVYLWILYSNVFSRSQDFLHPTVSIVVSAVVFVLAMLSYVQKWYDNIQIRFSMFGISIVAMLFVPTSFNVIGAHDCSTEEVESFSLYHGTLGSVLRVVFFLLIFSLCQTETISRLTFWLRFRGKKRLLKQVSNLNMPPMGQIHTTAKQRMYVIQRIAFQTFYALFLPWTSYPFVLFHFIMVSVMTSRSAIRNNDGMMKKFEDCPSSFPTPSQARQEEEEEESSSRRGSLDVGHRDPCVSPDTLSMPLVRTQERPIPGRVALDPVETDHPVSMPPACEHPPSPGRRPPESSYGPTPSSRAMQRPLSSFPTPPASAKRVPSSFNLPGSFRPPSQARRGSTLRVRRAPTPQGRGQGFSSFRRGTRRRPGVSHGSFHPQHFHSRGHRPHYGSSREYPLPNSDAYRDMEDKRWE